MSSYSTLSAAVDGLRNRGYTTDLTLEETGVRCAGLELLLHPEDFQIDEFHRFEGDTDPGDESIVYGISAPSRNIRGILVNGFGIYASSLTQAMVAKLATH
ncbi:MAG: phosphoribosylpyrophosphate synthetase [Flavobacteriales bacterium]